MEKEYMYNICDDEAVITEHADGSASVEIEGEKLNFSDCERAVKFLYKNGYRF